MAVDFSKVLERSIEGYQALTWALYILSGAIAAATLADISGTLLFVGSIIVIVLASSRAREAESTIYGSHLTNIKSTMTVGLIAAVILLAVTILTLGIGIIITWPLYVILLIWMGWKIIRGLMKLNDGVGY